MLRGLGAFIACAFFLAGSALAAPAFPALTGRVVDEARILSAPTLQSLTARLAEHEQKTGNQLVIVTVADLKLPIENYGIELARHWGIGQKGKDNGALLIISPNTREVRIEVGYGLEGTLTDALSSQIIQQVIIPAFKSGDWNKGVTDGVQAILSVLEGTPVAMPAPTHAPEMPQVKPWLLFGGIAVFLFLFIRYRGFRTWFLAMLFMGRGGRGGGGGGFRGGGGRFGGGGASGKW